MPNSSSRWRRRSRCRTRPSTSTRRSGRPVSKTRFWPQVDNTIEQKFHILEDKFNFFEIGKQNDILIKKLDETDKTLWKNSFNVQQMKRKLQELKDNQAQPKAAEEYQLATPPSSTARCPDCGVNYTIDSEYCRICSRKRT